MIVNSMTSFASMSGAHEVWNWAWEMRSVNARGLDIRVRLPDGFDDVEPFVREAIKARVKRGTVSIGLKLRSDNGVGVATISEPALARYIEACQIAETHALEAGLNLAPLTAGTLLMGPGVMQGASSEQDQTALKAAVKAQVEPLLQSFAESRASEGQAMGAIFQEQINQIEALAAKARAEAERRNAGSAALIRERVTVLLETTDLADEARLQQELAVITVKADVTEELDRLDAHVIAARELLKAGGAIGRKLDFLMQEFNREANTLCSKAGTPDLTECGVELKVIIDQLREQVQNVE